MCLRFFAFSKNYLIKPIPRNTRKKHIIIKKRKPSISFPNRPKRRKKEVLIIW